jgi:hypothetical protein
MIFFQRILTGLALVFLLNHAANGQMERRRVPMDPHVDDLFQSPSIIMMSSVTNIPKGNLNFSIMHSFGIVSDGAPELFGLDGTANIRFGLDYGVLDGLSVGVGRSRFDKLFDFRAKANLLRQTRDGGMPVEVALKGDVGITTLQNGYSFSDRLDFLEALLVARRFSDHLSLQVTPMMSHFNTVLMDPGASNRIIRDQNNHYALGIGGRWALNDRFAIVGEYIPVIGTRTSGTHDTFSLGLNIDTGGHVFQLFFTTSQWFTEQHTITNNTEDFFAGNFRFGFNVNRVFGLVH